MLSRLHQRYQLATLAKRCQGLVSSWISDGSGNALSAYAALIEAHTARSPTGKTSGRWPNPTNDPAHHRKRSRERGSTRNGSAGPARTTWPMAARLRCINFQLRGRRTQYTAPPAGFEPLPSTPNGTSPLAKPTERGSRSTGTGPLLGQTHLCTLGNSSYL